MDFADSPEHAAFRSEFRHWLEGNLPPEICVDDAADQRVAPDRETLEKRIAWQKTMHAAGWVGISWPKEYGGRGAGFMQQVIFDEEYFRARAPVLPTASALNLLGPTLIHWGTEEQKKRHLPRILNADELWCQGYSRARRRRRSRQPAHPRRRPGRPFRRQRAEGVDFGRAFRRLVLSIGAHRPRCAEASRHQLSAGRYEDAGDHGAAAGSAQWPPSLQRSLLRGCSGTQGEFRRAAEPGLESRDHDSDVRAQRGRRARPCRADRPPRRAGKAIPDPSGAGLEREPYPPATGAVGDRRQGVAGDTAARADPPVARRAAGTRRLDPQIVRLGAWRCGSPISRRPCSAPMRPSTHRPRRCPMPRAGTTACSAPANTRSPAAPARSSATSSASASSACRRGRACAMTKESSCPGLTRASTQLHRP